MNYDDSSLAWNWVTYKAERDYITFTNTTDPAAELLGAGKLLTESQAQAGVNFSVADDPSVSQSDFAITEKAPIRAFSWLKAPTGSPKIINIFKFRLRAIKRHQIKF